MKFTEINMLKVVECKKKGKMSSKDYDRLQVCGYCLDLNKILRDMIGKKPRGSFLRRENYALLKVSSDGHLHCVKACLAEGADVNFEEKYWHRVWSPLYNAVNRNQLDCVEYLIHVGAKITDNVLAIAARSGSERCVNLILKAGGDPDYMLQEAVRCVLRGVWLAGSTCISIFFSLKRSTLSIYLFKRKVL